MFLSAWALGSANAQDALHVRKAVFMEELGLPGDAVFDHFDTYAAHLLVCENGKPIASARLYAVAQDHYRGDMVCVLHAHRGQRYGDLCFRLMMDKAASMQAATLEIPVPIAHIPYFQAFGFQCTAKHTNGIQRMDVVPADIQWHAACGD